MRCSTLAFCQERFPAGSGNRQKLPDSFPVFERFRENIYFIADSNHGYKMIGVGHFVAEELLGNGHELLEPFRFSRYAEGMLHPASNRPFPRS